MEVASPLAFNTPGAGVKRHLACSPQLLDPSSHEMEIGDEPRFKRRRFHAESLTEQIANQSTLFGTAYSGGKSIFSPQGLNLLKRSRPDPEKNFPKDLSNVVEEQESLIDTLKKEKGALELSLQSLKTDHDRVVKENTILRKAVNIQQERQNHAERELKAAHQYREGAEDKMKKLEQLVLSLRYHLQAQQHANNGNDFLRNFSPDVY